MAAQGETLRWIRKDTSVRTAQGRITHLTSYALKCIASDTKTPAPVLKALMTLEEHVHLILSRCTFNQSNARLEGPKDIFQAIRARIRGYSNVFTCRTMIYFITALLGELIKFHS
ncbi:hypothetical protein DFAR_570029 [Desulfarculales bacterium]